MGGQEAAVGLGGAFEDVAHGREVVQPILRQEGSGWHLEVPEVQEYEDRICRGANTICGRANDEEVLLQRLQLSLEILLTIREQHGCPSVADVSCPLRDGIWRSPECPSFGPS